MWVSPFLNNTQVTFGHSLGQRCLKNTCLERWEEAGSKVRSRGYKRLQVSVTNKRCFLVQGVLDVGVVGVQQCGF